MDSLRVVKLSKNRKFIQIFGSKIPSAALVFFAKIINNFPTFNVAVSEVFYFKHLKVVFDFYINDLIS